mgnify:CR=1 FL=1
MNDNVIKFQRPKQPKPPRQTPPWMRRLLTWLAVIVAVGAIYAYFHLSNTSSL